MQTQSRAEYQREWRRKNKERVRDYDRERRSDTDIDWSPKIKWIMWKLDINQAQLASMINVEPSLISSWARDYSTPNSKNQKKLLSVEEDIRLYKGRARVGTYHCKLPKDVFTKGKCYKGNGCYYHKHCEIGGLR